MKLPHYFFILAAIFFMACQNNQQSQKNEESNTKIPTEQTCYRYTKNNDTASLMLISSGTIVTGQLNYQLFEKDSNNGVIKGEMRGDTLIADYSFDSEGMQSTRQVAFLKKDGKLLEGFGDVIEKDGKTVFKALSDLKFGNAIEFTKVNCN
ncbi:hypothetical protein WG904_00570 [Pedobacter sp. Du54]|uniref:hypothetical protein n=1 Tax=Pedobacter anseongensis TaxID=3133439 RepID=UPI0030A2003D